MSDGCADSTALQMAAMPAYAPKQQMAGVPPFVREALKGKDP